MVPSADLFTNPDLYTVLHSLPTGVTLANDAGRIVFSNAAADRILGVGAATDATPDEWTHYYGVFLRDGATPFPTQDYPLLRALAGEHTTDVEMVIRNATLPTGAVLSVSGQPLLDAAGKIKGAAVIFRDITRLRRTEKMKEELTSFIVHDLKNPLATILATCTLLEMSVTGEEAGADVETIRDAAERMGRMVLDLLDVQMFEDGALRLLMAPVPLAPLLGEVEKAGRARLQARGQRIRVDDAGPLSVLGDRQHLFRALMNLVDNCAKYGGAGGLVTVDVAPSEPATVTIRVSDDGPGVPVELRERIFDKYARVERTDGLPSRDSRGLGLRFCKVIAEAHGGRVWVEDGEPKGARFCFQLRLA